MSREFTDGQIVPGTRYRVLGHLGSGGMGSVYLVEHTELGKEFVLKALFRELAGRKDLVARLRQEWRSLARLNHPNIVNVTDAGTSDNGAPFYVMERVAGETLGQLLEREHALSVPRAIGIAAAVLDGLSAAHEIGIVHRDVKPPNIFVVVGGGVRLLDFGVAKLADQSAEVITARGVAIGTPRYMSPEQARGQAVDARTDLYAVGLVLFESIAGEGPFDAARDANELLIAHLSKPVPRLSSFHRGVSAELDDIVMSLLAKDPNARPKTARDVAATLRGLIRRSAHLPSISGSTPHAGYQAPTVNAITALPPTRPEGAARNSEPPTINAPLGLDGVARRNSEPPTINAPLGLDGAGRKSESPTINAPLGLDGVARRSNPPPGATTTVIGTPVLAGGTTLSASAPTRPGMDWAKDGFQTVAASSDGLLGVEDTLVASAPPSAIQALPLGADHTLPIDSPVALAPNEALTRTSIPVAALVRPPSAGWSTPDPSPLPYGFVETPPPFMSATPEPPARAAAASRLPFVLAGLAMLILVAGVGAFLSLRPAPIVPGVAAGSDVEGMPAASIPVGPAAEPAPKAAEPAPTAAEPAPKAAEPAPKAAEPAPKAAEPAPKAAEPAPKAAGPAPKAAGPVAPIPVAPAAKAQPSTQKIQKTPQKPQGKPVASKPTPAQLPGSGL